MSETNTDNAESANIVEQKDGVNFQLREFREGNAKGFKFTVPVFTTLEAAVAKYGAKDVLDIFNEALSGRLRNKIKNGMFNFPGEKPEVMRKAIQDYITKNPDGVIFSVADAENWQPGVREDSIKGLQEKAIKAMAEGNQTLALEMLRKAMEKKREKESMQLPAAAAAAAA